MRTIQHREESFWVKINLLRQETITFGAGRSSVLTDDTFLSNDLQPAHLARFSFHGAAGGGSVTGLPAGRNLAVKVSTLFDSRVCS
ncbi:MAG TPA: hypothetical protein VF586_19985, partial [Pyrinomonadaceae bacterium]